MKRLIAIAALGLAILSSPSVVAAQSTPAACILSLSTLDVQVAFVGPGRTVACQSALRSAGSKASVGYDAPVGNVACYVLYAPGDPNYVAEGALVYDSGSGQASLLCDRYARTYGLFVYDLSGQPWQVTS